ncbi:MAG TPA: uroporphyrinogen-III C-methyltransferase, partial [Vicinamibacterales bacterium]|nr:uroporphyrinogen-III C-methyltransferase [Vicinamibacterales bacterium]
GRRVLLVGGGPVAAAKLRQLLASAANIHVVSPEVVDDIERAGASSAVTISRREFTASDLDDAWLVVAAATPEVNRQVAEAAEVRRIFVNAVDDPANATAFLSGVIRREGVTLAISTSGEAPGLTALLRQGIDELLPRRDLASWLRAAREQRRKWKADGVAMEERKPLLLEALNRLYDRDGSVRLQPDVGSLPDVRLKLDATAAGFVSLVGAGPGDPALLTRKAIATLRASDLVLYDALVDERILRYARHAQRFFVGKREGRHVLSQEKINALMIRAARRGRRVVRLKGGDPFVLGRGGEEAIALSAAGVPFEVVPGISSAIAAPALAGIPVTHRGLASSFLVVSGHDVEAFSAATSGLEPRGVTLVVLMGLARTAALAARLLDQGWIGETPAAVIVDASSSGQQVWRGTLSDLAGGAPDVVAGAAAAPGTIVVGEVVSLAEALCQPSMIRPHTAARG